MAPLQADKKPEDIYESIRPHLMLIESLDGQGSGILVDESGLVLTSLHVVASGMKLTLTGREQIGGSLEVPQQFENGRLHKVHPTLDLALVKFDIGTHKVRAAKIPDRPAELKNGEVCYALGSPAGGEGALSNSITNGVISAARRDIEGDPLIQFSAPVNPGNSGGPLCDAEGMIVGVVTMKLEQREGIAFAIPFGGIEVSKFIDPIDRKGDQKLLEKLLEQAKRFHSAANRAMFDLRPPDPEYLGAAATLAQMALVEEPGNMECLQLLAELYSAGNEESLARAYVERGLELAPGDGALAVKLGNMDFRDGRKEEAERSFRSVLANAGGEPLLAGHGASRLAMLLSKEAEADWSEIGYLLGWARELYGSLKRKLSEDYEKLYQQALVQMDDNHAAVLMRLNGDFSEEGLKAFMGPEVELPGQVRLVRKLFSEERIERYREELRGYSERQLDEGEVEGGEVPLPDHFTRVLPVLGGTAVVIVFEKLSKVGIYDLKEGRLTRFITLPKKTTKVAAGGKHLILVDPEEVSWRIYDLEDEDAEVVTASQEGMTWILQDVEMSPYRSDLAWFVFTEENGGVGVMLCAIGEKEPLARLLLPMGESGFKDMMAKAPDVSASATGMTLIGRRGEETTAGDILRLDTRLGSLTYKRTGTSLAGFGASAHSDVLVTQGGLFRYPTLENVWRPQNRLARSLALFPIFGSESFLQLSAVREDSEHVFVRVLNLPLPKEKSEPVAVALERMPGNVELGSAASRVPYYVHATIGSRRVAVFLNAAKKVRTVIAPSLVETVKMEKGRKDVAVPGERYERVLELPAFEKATLEDAPNGVSFDAGTRVLGWDLPAETKPNSFVEVLILLELADGTQQFHVEKIEVGAAE
ncbi:MAG: trypsin-like peptidase domain-containing protein [Verrucomicrobia bacterium]|nr:trypsin-like peptidase domain-containing protein [Verrucomicrobiota bacterium]MDA1005530.1 trypsin-like peptidase domain-containing protein [Verrucomicrobiota bacterium]